MFTTIWIASSILAFLINVFLLFKYEKKRTQGKRIAHIIFENFNFLNLGALILVHIIPTMGFLFTWELTREIKEVDANLLSQNEKEKTDKLAQFLSAPNQWNLVYQCENCSIFSRYYQLVESSELRKKNHCPHCKHNEEMKFISGAEELNLPFAEKIKEEEVVEHMIHTSEKWMALEEKQAQLEKEKFAIEMEINQLKAYEKLHSEDLTHKLTLYEQKLIEHTKEMEDFKVKLLRDFE